MGNSSITADERVARVHLTEEEIRVTLMDGRTVSAPLAR
jgi:hypothetical protein